MTNTSTVVKEIAPLGGATLGGYKLGWLVATAKAAMNDTVTITNASTINTAFLQITATGASEANTLATNVITCTSATTGQVQGLLIYKDD
jgi:hypothetical protein